ncbi:hypothetical protein KEM09_21825 [Carboxylicivirga mesophila]|uniref:Uncharacterized protein n=1 Tax=Carboxylicivirga mesophila TaxID=1166478 RepID=A0ABS5KG58_9BACT|nr:hypothetical protein [Carboxylicivirga mesophila]MBS2214059.1 hypothetical protein [Carboxylicivirga mesophila]
MNETLRLESLEYINGIKTKSFIGIIIFLFVISLLALVFPTHPNNGLGGILIITTVIVCLIGFYYRYYFEKTRKIGEIIIDYNCLIFFELKRDIEEIEFIGIYHQSYRGRIRFRRHEFPLPEFGLNNKIKVITKTKETFEASFIVRKKKNRKLLDKYIKHWIDKGLSVHYCIDNNEITRN